MSKINKGLWVAMTAFALGAAAYVLLWPTR